MFHQVGGRKKKTTYSGTTRFACEVVLYRSVKSSLFFMIGGMIWLVGLGGSTVPEMWAVFFDVPIDAGFEIYYDYACSSRKLCRCHNPCGRLSASAKLSCTCDVLLTTFQPPMQERDLI